MNSCVLMAQIVSDPELRLTPPPDQRSVSSMMVEFESTREGDPPSTVQVEGWGNLAEEMKNSYHRGDRIIIEGRLSMNLFEMPEGYTEKRAKLVASRIYPLNSLDLASAPTAAYTSSNEGEVTGRTQFTEKPRITSPQSRASSTEERSPTIPNSNTTYSNSAAEPSAPVTDDADSSAEGDWDEIPF